MNPHYRTLTSVTFLSCVALRIRKHELYARAKRNELPFAVVKSRNRYYVDRLEWMRWLEGVVAKDLQDS